MKKDYTLDWLGQKVRVGDVVQTKANYSGAAHVVKRVKKISNKCIFFDVEARDFVPGCLQRYHFDKGYVNVEQKSAQFLKLPGEYLDMYFKKIEKNGPGDRSADTNNDFDRAMAG